MDGIKLRDKWGEQILKKQRSSESAKDEFN